MELVIYKVTARWRGELIRAQLLKGPGWGAGVSSASLLEERKTGLEKSTGLGMCLQKGNTGKRMKNTGPLTAELAT